MWMCEKCGVNNPGDVYSCRICGAQPPSSAGLHTRRLPPLPAPVLCPRCQSEKMMLGVKVAGYGSDPISLQIPRIPPVIFNAVVSIPVLARACGDCGYAEFYIESASKLWEAYERAQRKG